MYLCTSAHVFFFQNHIFLELLQKCSTFCYWFLILMNTKQSLHSIFDMLWNISSLENWNCNLCQSQNKKYYINVNLIWKFNKELNFEIKCGKKMETFNKLVLQVDSQKWVLSPQAINLGFYSKKLQSDSSTILTKCHIHVAFLLFLFHTQTKLWKQKKIWKYIW